MRNREPDERRRRTTTTLIIKLIIFYSVLAYMLVLLKAGVEVTVAAVLLPAVVGLAVKAGKWITSNGPEEESQPANESAITPTISELPTPLPARPSADEPASGVTGEPDDGAVSLNAS